MPIELQEILEEQDAWRLALSWQNTLRGSIRLVRSYRLGHLVDSYDWVALSLDQTKPLDELLHHVYTFRAAVSVWTAISSCRGYSGRENPAFWKLVFGKLRDYGDERELPRSDAYDSRLFDALRFFYVCGEDSFPRIRLFRNDVQHEDAYKKVILVNTFFHAQDKTAAIVDIDRQYATIMEMLNPYIQRARWSRVIPISLDISNSGLPASMRGVLDVLPTLRTNSEGEYPVFAARVASFVTSDADNPFEVQTLKELMLHLSINVNYFTFGTPTAAIALTTHASYYRLILGIDQLVVSYPSNNFCAL